MKKPLVIIIGILAVLLVLSVTKDFIIKTSVEKGVEVVTGLSLKIRSMNVGIIRTLVGIKNLTLFNPKGYPERTMLDMPEIYVDYNLPDIIKGKVHLEEMRINMKEFVVVKNEKGELNLNSLKVVQAQKAGTKPAAKEGKIPEIQIDELQLKIGKVIYKDYSKGSAPVVKEFDMRLEERYSNITDPYSLVSLIVVKALMNTTIANLAGFDLKGLQGTVGDALATAQKVAQEAATKAQAAVGQATKQAQEAATQAQQQAQEKVKEAADSLKETFKLPFGSD